MLLIIAFTVTCTQIFHIWLKNVDIDFVIGMANGISIIVTHNITICMAEIMHIVILRGIYAMNIINNI